VWSRADVPVAVVEAPFLVLFVVEVLFLVDAVLVVVAVFAVEVGFAAEGFFAVDAALGAAAAAPSVASRPGTSPELFGKPATGPLALTGTAISGPTDVCDSPTPMIAT
jgi:hypothetical protein